MIRRFTVEGAKTAEAAASAQAPTANKAGSIRGFTLIEIMVTVLIIGILMAIAMPNMVKTRETTRSKACSENLRKIDWAKDQWALEYSKPATATPTETDLAGSFKYLLDLPLCPGGGAYTINNVSTPPTCSYGGGGIHKRFE